LRFVFVKQRIIEKKTNTIVIPTASLQRARGVPTTRPRRSRKPHSVPTARCLTRCANGVYFEHAKKQTPPHGVLGDCTARTQHCWQLHSAHLGDMHFLERCGNAVRMPLWCDRGLTNQFTIKPQSKLKKINLRLVLIFSIQAVELLNYMSIVRDACIESIP